MKNIGENSVGKDDVNVEKDNDEQQKESTDDEGEEEIGENEEENEPSTSLSPMRKWRRCFIILLILLLYMFLGALVFRALEGPRALQAADDFDAAMVRLASSNDCVDEDDVDELMGIVTKAIGEGGYAIQWHQFFVRHAANYSNEENKETLFSELWSFKPTLVFVTTVVTTIGFGFTAPRTNKGQLFCVIYAIFGISLTGAIILTIGKMIKGLGEYRAKFTKKLEAIMPHVPHLSWTARLFLNILLVHLLLVLPSSLSYYFEQHWSYLDCYYLAIQVMTTIGFGDLQPTDGDVGDVVHTIIQSAQFMYFFFCIGALSNFLESLTKAEQRGAMYISRRVSKYTSNLSKSSQSRTDVKLKSTRRSKYSLRM